MRPALINIIADKEFQFNNQNDNIETNRHLLSFEFDSQLPFLDFAVLLDPNKYSKALTIFTIKPENLESKLTLGVKPLQ